MIEDRFEFKPQYPNFAQNVRKNFAKQNIMNLIGATLTRVEPGEVEISLPYRQDLTQQDGFLHAGVITTIIDSACGYAAFSLMAEAARVLSVEFKVNLLSPAQGDRFEARGKVLKSGRTLTFCSGEVFSVQDNKTKLIATMSATMIQILDAVNPAP